MYTSVMNALETRIATLEEKMNMYIFHAKDIKSIKQRLESLEEYPRGHHENPIITGGEGDHYSIENICTNVDKLIKEVKELDLKSSLIPQGIERLLEVNVTNIHERINEIDEFKKDLIDQLAKTNFKLERLRSDCKQVIEKNNDRPHRCPICNGDGIVFTEFKSRSTIRLSGKYKMDEEGRTYMECEPCNGKGILWK